MRKTSVNFSSPQRKQVVQMTELKAPFASGSKPEHDNGFSDDKSYLLTCISEDYQSPKKSTEMFCSSPTSPLRKRRSFRSKEKVKRYLRNFKTDSETSSPNLSPRLPPGLTDQMCRSKFDFESLSICPLTTEICALQNLSFVRTEMKTPVASKENLRSRQALVELAPQRRHETPTDEDSASESSDKLVRMTYTVSRLQQLQALRHPIESHHRASADLTPASCTDNRVTRETTDFTDNNHQQAQANAHCTKIDQLKAVFCKIQTKRLCKTAE